MTNQTRNTSRLWIVTAAAVVCFGCRPVATDSGSESPALVAPAPEGVTPTEPPAASNVGASPTCETASGWRPENIELPPDFAPELPGGQELLWFAPGMFEPGAADYFTYVFELDFDEAVSVDIPSLEPLLAGYYRGLMTAVAGSKREAGEVAVVLGEGADGRLLGRIEMTDEFTGGERLAVEIELEMFGSCVVASVTPDRSESNLAALAGARRCLPCTQR